jgi:hypothetical protein
LFYFGKKIKGDNASSVSAQNLATTIVIEKLKLWFVFVRKINFFTHIDKKIPNKHPWNRKKKLNQFDNKKGIENGLKNQIILGKKIFSPPWFILLGGKKVRNNHIQIFFV